MVISGFYRVWTHNKENSEASQVTRMDIFVNQIKTAAETKNDLIIMGDANLDANKWNKANYIHAKIVSDLFQVIDENGIKIENVGNTYQADHAQANGNISESALDHVYTRFGNLTETIKLEDSSSDHVPVLCKLKYKKKTYTRQIRKRTLKDFSEERWNEILHSKDYYYYFFF